MGKRVIFLFGLGGGLWCRETLEALLELALNKLEVSAATGAGGSPALGLDAPVI